MKKVLLLFVLISISISTYSEGIQDFNIKVSYSEYLNQNNEIEVRAIYHFNNDIHLNIQPTILLLENWTLDSVNYVFDREYLKDEELEVVFTISNHTGQLSFYPEEFYIQHKPTLEDKPIQALFYIYFTPYETTEVLGEEAMTNLNRVWYAKSDESPQRINIEKDSIPISDIPVNFVPEYDWELNFRTKHIPGLAYSIPMMAIAPEEIPDSVKNQAGKGGDGCAFSKKFVGNVKGRVMSLFLNEETNNLVSLALRGIDIEIVEVNDAWVNVVLGETTTDANGYFSVWVDVCRAFEGDNLNIFIRVKGRNEYYNIYASKSGKLYSNVEKHEFPVQLWHYANGNVSDFDFGNINAYHETIKAVHLSVLAYEFANTFSGQTIPNNLIIKTGCDYSLFFPDISCGQSIPIYSSLIVPDPAIRLQSGDVLSESILWHEFGHFLMWHLQNKCWIDLKSGSFAKHSLNESSNNRIAWTEGWAHAYMAICDAYYRNLDNESAFDDDRNNFETRILVTPQNNISNGFASEFYIGSSIYDLWDGPDKFQHISGGVSNNDILGWSQEVDDVSFSFSSICDVIRNGDPYAATENNGKIEDIQRFHLYFTNNIKCTLNNDKVNKVFYYNQILNNINSTSNIVNSDMIYKNNQVNYTGSAIESPIFSWIGAYNYINTQKENISTINSSNLNYNLPYVSDISTLNQDLNISTNGVLFVNNYLAPGIILGNTSTVRPPVNSTVNYELCNSKTYTIGSNGLLVIGDASGNYKADFKIKSGSIIRLQLNSVLRINNNSKLIIESGGKLIIEQGSTINLDGLNAVIENFGTIELTDGTVLNKTGNGFIKFKGTNSESLKLGVNSKFVYNGSGKTDKVIEVENGEATITSESGSEFLISNANINYSNGRLIVKSKLVLTNVKSDGSGMGLIASGNNVVNITDCEFSGTIRGLELYYSSSSGTLATIYNSTFSSHPAYDIKTYGRAFSIDNCLFSDSHTPIYAQHISDNSFIESCYFENFPDTAIYLNGTSVPTVNCNNIKIGNVSQYYSIKEALVAINCIVTLSCSEMYSKENAIHLGLNASLDMSNENTSTFGNNIISKVPGDDEDRTSLITLTGASQLYMRNGFNTLKKNVSTTNSTTTSFFIQGGLVPFSQTIDAINNFWYVDMYSDNGIPNSNSHIDFGIFKTSIDFDPIAVEGDYDNPCLMSNRLMADPCADPNNCPTSLNILNNCSECNTVNFKGKSINKYLKKIIKEIRLDTLKINTVQHIMSLDSLLNVNFLGNKPKVDLVKDRALHLLLKQYSLIQNDVTYAIAKPIALNKIRAILNHRLARAINKDDTARIVQVHLIKAHLFLSENLHSQAINQFDNALNYFEINSEEYQTIQLQKCLVNIEDLFENGLINDSVRIQMMFSCETTQTISSRSLQIQNSSPQLPTLDTRYVKINPNPANDWLNVEFVNFSNNEAKITVYDLIGRIVLEKKLSLQGDGNIESTQLDISILMQGTYIVKIKSNNFVKMHKQIVD